MFGKVQYRYRVAVPPYTCDEWQQYEKRIDDAVLLAFVVVDGCVKAVLQTGESLCIVDHDDVIMPSESSDPGDPGDPDTLKSKET